MTFVFRSIIPNVFLYGLYFISKFNDAKRFMYPF